MIRRGGGKMIYIPGDSIRVTQPAAAVAVIPWWLSGGISASNCVAAYQPKGAASLAASYVNLANPGTYNAAPGVAPTWDATNGWIFNGTTQYLDTGITPATNQTWSMIIRWSNIHTNSSFCCLAGCSLSGGNGFAVAIRSSDSPDTYYYYNGGILAKLNIRTVTSGISAVAGNMAYHNGTAETGTIGTFGTPNIYKLYVGVLNNAGSPYFAPRNDSNIQAVAIYNAVVSSAQILALSTAMAAL